MGNFSDLRRKLRREADALVAKASSILVRAAELPPEFVSDAVNATVDLASAMSTTASVVDRLVAANAAVEATKTAAEKAELLRAPDAVVARKLGVHVGAVAVLRREGTFPARGDAAEARHLAAEKAATLAEEGARSALLVLRSHIDRLDRLVSAAAVAIAALEVGAHRVDLAAEAREARSRVLVSLGDDRSAAEARKRAADRVVKLVTAGRTPVTFPSPERLAEIQAAEKAANFARVQAARAAALAAIADGVAALRAWAAL